MTRAGEARSRRRLAAAGATALISLAALASGAAWLWLRDPEPPLDGMGVAMGLSAPVEVVRDRHGVPHVSAGSLRDAYLGLGFAHAQSRLWQMELLRRSAHGRLSELFGSSTVPADRLARTLGLGSAAASEWTGVGNETRELLQAYSNGVNAWLRVLREGRAELPLELRWLGLDPEPWTPQDTLAIVRLRSWLMGRSLGASLLLDRLVREIGGVESSDFFPVRPSDGALDTLATVLELGRVADAFAHGVGMNGPVGSLGFVVGAQRSASRAPLLVNDPHVQFGLPPLFFLAHLSVPRLELGGATWPGVPVFWTGTNRVIAWGQVATSASVSELVREELHPEPPVRYELNGRWLDVERRVETIRVAGSESLEFEILSTRNGPLLDALLPEDRNARSLALRWAASEGQSGIGPLMRVQVATSWQEFRRALEPYPGPVASFLYADAREIGQQVAGLLPVRPVQTSLLPVVGGSRYYDWRGFIPFDLLPRVHGSARSWLVASTHPERLEYGNRVVWLWSSPGAETRLRERLSAGPPLDLAQVLSIERERYSERGRRAARALLSGSEFRSAQARRLSAILARWDGRTDVSSRGALVYRVFRQELSHELVQTRLGAQWADTIASAAAPVPGVVLERFLDRADPRTVSALVEPALDRTWRVLQARIGPNPARWRWGAGHQLRLPHAFELYGSGALRWLGRRLGRGPHPVGGDPDSIWTMHAVATPDGVAVGPVLRYAVDLADSGHPRVGLAGGQSGHADSEHYDDALALWLAGQPRTLWMHAVDVAYHRAGSWKLRPPREQAAVR